MFGLQVTLLYGIHIALGGLECVCLANTSILGKHLVNQFDSGLYQRYRVCISTSWFLRERFDVDSEQFL
jgi:hypothetical protein